MRDEILAAYLADNVKARQLRPDGSYVRLRDASQPAFNVQDFLVCVAEGKADIADIPKRPHLVAEMKKQSTRPPKKRSPTATAAD